MAFKEQPEEDKLDFGMNELSIKKQQERYRRARKRKTDLASKHDTVKDNYILLSQTPVEYRRTGDIPIDNLKARIDEEFARVYVLGSGDSYFISREVWRSFDFRGDILTIRGLSGLREEHELSLDTLTKGMVYEHLLNAYKIPGRPAIKFLAKPLLEQRRFIEDSQTGKTFREDEGAEDTEYFMTLFEKKGVF